MLCIGLLSLGRSAAKPRFQTSSIKPEVHSIFPTIGDPSLTSVQVEFNLPVYIYFIIIRPAAGVEDLDDGGEIVIARWLL